MKTKRQKIYEIHMIQNAYLDNNLFVHFFFIIFYFLYTVYTVILLRFAALELALSTASAPQWSPPHNTSSN